MILRRILILAIAFGFILSPAITFTSGASREGPLHDLGPVSHSNAVSLNSFQPYASGYSQVISGTNQTWLNNSQFQSPQGIAYDPLNHNMYVAESGFMKVMTNSSPAEYSDPVDCLTIINGQNNTLTGSIHTSIDNPFAVNYDPFWNSLLVSNTGYTEVISLYNNTGMHVFNASHVVVNTVTGNYYAVEGGYTSKSETVSIFAGNTYSLIGSIRVHQNVSSMSFDSSLDELVIATDSSLLIVNGQSNSIVHSYPVEEEITNGSYSWYSGPRYMAIADSGYSVFIDGQYSGIALVNLTDGNVTWHEENNNLSGYISSFYYDPSLDLLFVGTISPGQIISIASGSDGVMIYRIMAPVSAFDRTGPFSGITGIMFDPADNTLYASWGGLTQYYAGGLIGLIELNATHQNSPGPILSIYDYAGITFLASGVAALSYFAVMRRKKG